MLSDLAPTRENINGMAMILALPLNGSGRTLNGASE